MSDLSPQEILLETAKKDNTQLTLLGQPGFAATLIKCQGPMKKYNGQQCKPKPVANGAYDVELEYEGQKVSLQLPAKSIEVIVDFVELEEMAALDQGKGSKKKGHFSGNNRGNAKIAVETMVTNVKKAIEALTEKGEKLEDVFARFDENGNGELDQNEFLAGCLMLSVSISKTEIEMIWPVLIAPAVSGQIKIERFKAFVEGSASSRERGKKLSGADAALSRRASASKDRLLLQSQANGRASRIRRASVSVGIRDTVKVYCDKNKVTPEEMFKTLDDDGTGVISKKELLEALKKLKFAVTPEDLTDIWPMLNADGGRQITAKEWAAFVDGRTPSPKRSSMRKRAQTEGGAGAGGHVGEIRRLSQQRQRSPSKVGGQAVTTSVSEINMRKTGGGSGSSLPGMMAEARRASAGGGGTKSPKNVKK